MFNGLSRDFSSLISCLAGYLRYLITVESDHVWSLDLEKPGTGTKSSSIIWALMLCRRPGGPFWNTPRSVWVWTQTHLSLANCAQRFHLFEYIAPFQSVISSRRSYSPRIWKRKVLITPRPKWWANVGCSNRLCVISEILSPRSRNLTEFRPQAVWEADSMIQYDSIKSRFLVILVPNCTKRSGWD
jgi:hypothetical protein